MFNITKDKSQPSCNVIKHYNVGKFRYDRYLTIFVFQLLSFVVVVDI